MLDRLLRSSSSRWSSLALLSAAALWSTSCGGSDSGGSPIPTDPVDPTAVSATVTPASATVEVSNGVNFTLTVNFSDGTSDAFTTGASWTSSAPTVASINTSGQALGLSAGSTTITGRAEGVSATATLTVTQPPVASVTVDPTSAEIEVGEARTLTATTLDASGNELTGRTVTWSSDDAGVASVSSSGAVTGVAPGTATITAESEGQSATSTITVVPAAVATVTLEPGQSVVELGRTQQLTASTFDTRGAQLAGREVVWASTDTGIAIVDANGLVTAVGVGSATITGTSEGVVGSASISVVPRPVATVEVSPPTSALVVNGTLQLSAVTRDSDGGVLTDRTIVWSSSDNAVANVSATGFVTAIAPGSATITASSEGQSGTATVTVSAVPVASVEVSPAAASVQQGATQQLTATTKDANGAVLTGRTVTWATSDASVATVDSNGRVSAVAVGSATITATSEGQSGTATVTVTPIPVASVEVAPATASVLAGATQQLTATPRDAASNALTGRTVTWTTSDAAVATVDTNGLVTAVATGTTTITATSEGVQGSATITVVPNLPDLVFTGTLTTTTPTFQQGGTLSISSIAYGNTGTADANGFVSQLYASADATLDPAGDVVLQAGGLESLAASGSGTYAAADLTPALGVGTWRIYWALDANGNVTEIDEGNNRSNAVTIEITAVPVGVATVEVTPATASILTGGSVQLTATTKDAQGQTLAGRTVTWSSSDTGVATVDSNGFVSGVGGGTATVTATSEGRTGTSTITVTVPVASVEVTPATATVAVGATQQLTATTRDVDGNVLTGRTVTWSSSNVAAATVDSNGLVTGVAAGAATIVATSEGQTANSAITVQTAVGSVEVAPFGGSFAIGNSINLTGTIKDGDGNVVSGSVNWSSSNTGVATVNSNGTVTGVGVGSATITGESGGASAGVTVSITNPGAFAITLIYSNDVPSGDRAVFDAAAAQWSGAITGDLQDFGSNLAACGTTHPALSGGVDDVTIFVTVESIDGPFNTLASAGPCYTRVGGASNGFPITGSMRFDADDLAFLRANNAYQGTVVHEMGHVLGIGTLWDNFGLTTGTTAATCEASQGADPVFTGALAIAAFDAAGGAARTSKVPLEDQGTFQNGSNCGHWRESTMDTELMTPSLDAGVTNALSAITLQSLADMGYTINLGAAEAYTVPNPLAAPGLREDRPRIHLHGDIRYPLFGVTMDGVRIPLRDDPRRR